MGLFGFKKDKKATLPKEKIHAEGSYNIKVLGSGCKSCQTLFSNLQEAVKDMDIDAQISHVTDLASLAEYGIMTTPALVINEKVVSAGKILKPCEIEKLIVKFHRGE